MLLYCTCLPTNSRGPACFTSTLKGTCCLPTSCFFTASCSWPTGKWPSRRQAPCSCWTMHRLHWGSGHSGQHAGCSHLLHEYLLNASLITAIIHLVQNIFNKDPSHRTISLNDTYIILFKNPRNKSQCTTGTSNCTPAATGSWHHLQGCHGHACPQLHGHWLKQGTSDGWRAGHVTCTTTPCFPMKTFLRHLPTVPPQRIEQILGPGWDNGAFIHQRACLPWQQGSATITTATYMLMTKTLAAGLTTTARHSSRMQPCSIAIPWLPAPRSDAGMIPCNLCRNMHPICILAKAQPKVVRQLISCTYKDLIQTSQSVPPAPWWYCSAIAAGQAHICPEGPQVQDGQSAWQEGPADWWQLFRPAGQHHSPLLIK